jgi:hypothetical protein
MLVTLSFIARPKQRYEACGLDPVQGQGEQANAAFAPVLAADDRTDAEASSTR